MTPERPIARGVEVLHTDWPRRLASRKSGELTELPQIVPQGDAEGHLCWPCPGGILSANLPVGGQPSKTAWGHASNLRRYEHG